MQKSVQSKAGFQLAASRMGGWKQIGNKSREIQKLGVKYYGVKTGNFHTNFVDLNPSWAQARHERAVKAANKVLEKVKIQMSYVVDEKAILIFKQQVRKGKRLDFDEIGELKPASRQAYKEVMQQKDDEINQYMDAVQEKAQN